MGKTEEFMFRCRINATFKNAQTSNRIIQENEHSAEMEGRSPVLNSYAEANEAADHHADRAVSTRLRAAGTVNWRTR